MRATNWEIPSRHKVRCEVCQGSFGLTRRRFAQKQFCSAHCLEWYMAQRESRVASFRRSTDEALKSNPN
jgi:hypothetical protein